jgi:DNA/RNA-binding domain of Phe-tRNA-synthetase-like protein
VVDLYNAVSLRFAVPVGGEDARSYLSAPTLCRAKGDEPFATMSEGAPKTETPEVGEVIWCDAAGVTCRRWNWRQGPRTQLTEVTTDMWFVLERLGPMPIEALIEAGQAIARGLTQIAPAARIEATLLDLDRPAGSAIQL